ncbi:hypothetical protein [Eubacterium ramulus]
MKNKKIRGWIILILIVIAGIIALLVALKRNKKESFDQVTNADGAIVKENVQVINEENAPDQVTENTLVYISNNPKYKKGDVLVSGIIDGADAGFIRRVTNVNKKNDVYVYETEPALLTDVFEEAHIIRRFQLTEEGVEEDDFSENKNDIINNSSFQNSTYSVIQLMEEDSNSGIKYKQSLIDDYEFDLTPEEDNGDEDKDDEDWISVSSKGGLSVWEEITVEIEDGDIKCGISLQSKAEASIVAEYSLEEEKEFEKTIFSKNLPNYQFLVAGWIPMVVTNEVDAILNADAKLEGNLTISYTPSVEGALGFLYDSKKGKVETIKKFEKNIDALQWNTEMSLSGSASANINLHYIVKLYGAAGIDIGAGIYGSAEGSAQITTNGGGTGELSGNMDLKIGPQLSGTLILDMPIFTTESLEKEIFSTDLEPFWSRHWEVAESVNDTVQEQVGEGNQYNESNQTQIGNLGTTYRTRFADVNQLDACRFQFDIPPGWKVESEQVGALMDVIQEQVIITNDRGVTVTYWDLPQELGGRSGVVMEQVNITKAADTDFMWSVRDPTDEADLLSTENYMVARIQTTGSLNAYTDTEFTPADGTRFALLPVSELGEREFKGQAGDVDEFSFNYYGLHAFIAEAPDGNFTAKEEKEVIQILQSFKEY